VGDPAPGLRRPEHADPDRRPRSRAIYAFRGADVYSYLDAVATAHRVQTLPTNWRSDAALLDGWTG
jgi:hypothetical protein